jgi:regulatory protein
MQAEPFIARDPTDGAAAERTALRIIGAASQSEQALRQKLLRRQYTPEVVDALLTRLIEAGIVDDRAQAGALARRRLSRGYSAMIVRRELRQKGLDQDLVDETAAEITEQDEVMSARSILERMPRRQGEPALRHRTRCRASLARRGFSMSVIHQAEAPAEDEDGLTG